MFHSENSFSRVEKFLKEILQKQIMLRRELHSAQVCMKKSINEKYFKSWNFKWKRMELKKLKF